MPVSLRLTAPAVGCSTSRVGGRLEVAFSAVVLQEKHRNLFVMNQRKQGQFCFSKVLLLFWQLEARKHCPEVLYRVEPTVSLKCILTSCVVLTWCQFWSEQTRQSRPGQVEAYSWTESSGYCSRCPHPCLYGKMNLIFMYIMKQCVIYTHTYTYKYITYIHSFSSS